MSAVLFVTWSGGGNLPPALAMAAELRDRGHEVRFLGHPEQAERVAAAGLEFRPYATAMPFSAADPGGPLTMLKLLGDRAMARDVLADVDVRPTDLVVVDFLLFEVMRTLGRVGRPYAVLEHTFDGWLRRAAKGPMGIALRLRGYRPLDLVDAGVARVAATLRELDDGFGDVVHVGPVVTGVPARPEQATVLVSLSTYSFPALGKTWQRVLDAVDGLPARVVVTTGGAVDPGTLRVPSGVEVHDWLDHGQIMPAASLLVGHGGHGTTMAALAHDLPVLVVPVDGASDQAFVGGAVERAGAGRTLGHRSSPKRVRAAIEELLADGPHRAGAARLGARIREQDGRKLGADALESAASEVSGRRPEQSR